jgi:hypothetical protein
MLGVGNLKTHLFQHIGEGLIFLFLTSGVACFCPGTKKHHFLTNKGIVMSN